MKYLIISMGVVCIIFIMDAIVDWLDQWLWLKDRPASMVGRFLFTEIDVTEKEREVIVEVSNRFRNSEQSKSE